MPVVVVFPCTPAIPQEKEWAENSPSASEYRRIGIPRSAAARSSGFSSRL
jgi:hypothetical protein